MSLLSLAFVTIASASHPVPADAPTFCAAPYEEVSVNVRFSAYHENAVQIMDRRGQVVASFNNYIGHGAGSEWQRSGGRVTLPVDTRGTCFTVRGLHKDGPPSPWLPWESSLWQQWDDYIAFEDSTDWDYTDATVRITRSRVGVRPAPGHDHLHPSGQHSDRCDHGDRGDRREQVYGYDRPRGSEASWRERTWREPSWRQTAPSWRSRGAW